MNTHSFAIASLLLCFAFAFGGVGFGQVRSDLSNKPVEAEVDGWANLLNEQKPGVIWWIPGSAMDEANMTANLEQLAEAGFGGVSMVPIYGVKGAEKRFIEYLSPRWLEMYQFTSQEANRLGLWLDLTPGTGWKIGGPNLVREDTEFQIRKRQAKVEINQIGAKVKRAAPGGEGFAINPFAPEVLKRHLAFLDSKLAAVPDAMPRAFYHDSFEYDGNWTKDFYDRFRQDHDYDLSKHVDLLFSSEATDEADRVRSDYRETLGKLHMEFLETLKQWAHGHGSLLREQAHGAPGNILDMYAMSDIPETEVFGAGHFDIQGFRREPGTVRDGDDHSPLVNRMASSAAHIAGRKLVSSESFTWLREHFNTAISHIKPEADSLFLAGINQIFYHGTCYSPQDEPFPGWLFYASTQVNPRNSIWHDIPAFNRYIQRCQSILQSGKANNDLLVYWPYYDVLAKPTEGTAHVLLKVHNHRLWMTETPCGDLANRLLALGYSFDFVSDRYLQSCTWSDGKLQCNGTEYRAIAVPACKYIPLETLAKLVELQQAGAPIVFVGGLPESVPGRRELAKRQGAFQALKSRARVESKSPVAEDARDTLLASLQASGVYPEAMVQSGLRYIRRTTDKGLAYFIVNQSAGSVDDWVTLQHKGSEALILDPMTGQCGRATMRSVDGKAQVYLQLASGESRFVRFEKVAPGQGQWPIWESKSQPRLVEGRWEVTFLQGGPVIPSPTSIDSLGSWTEFGSDDVTSFAGTARYRIEVEVPAALATASLLSLGDVRESARVRWNGEEVQTLVANPYQCVVRNVRAGKNVLEIDVTNLSANRIRDLDRRKVEWRNFYDINFVNLNYKPFDASEWMLRPSGLLGPVTLEPLAIRSLE